MISRPSSQPPDSDLTGLANYWDSVVHRDPDTPLPIPVTPPDLNPTVYQVHAIDEAARHRPAYADRLLTDLLSAWEEPKMTVQSLALVPPIDFVPLPPITLRSNRGLKWSWAALLALFVISAMAIGQFYSNRPADNRPSIIMASPAVSPTTMPLPADGSGTIIWRSSESDDPMLTPSGITIAPDGNIWVGDAGRNQFRIYSPDGTLLETWGEAGDQTAEFNFSRARAGLPDEALTDIAFAQDGSFYVVDTFNTRIQKFAADRTYVTRFGTRGGGPGQFAEPVSVTVGRDGSVYVVDDLRSVVQQFTSDGEYVQTVVLSGWDPGRINYPGNTSAAFGGTIWVADFGNNRIQQYSSSGEFLFGFGRPGAGRGEFNGPSDIAFAADGLTYIADTNNHRLQVFNHEALFVAEVTLPGEDDFVPGSIAVDGIGNVYALSTVSGELIKFQVVPAPDPSLVINNPIYPDFPANPPFAALDGGSVATSWNSASVINPLIEPGSVAVAPDNEIWVIDAARDMITIFSPQGSYQHAFGWPGSEPGQFAFESGDWSGTYPLGTGQIVFRPDGSFLVVDPGNHRIQMFDPDRQYLGQFGDATKGDAIIDKMGPIFLLPSDQIGVYDGSSTGEGTFELVVFDADGQYLHRQTFNGFAPIAFGPEGDYWAVPAPGQNESTILNHYTAQGEILGKMTDLVDGSHADLIYLCVGAIDRSGNLWLANALLKEVTVVGPDGVIQLTWTGSDSIVGNVVEPSWLALDRNNSGIVYIVDRVALNVGAYTVSLPPPTSTPVP